MAIKSPISFEGLKNSVIQSSKATEAIKNSLKSNIRKKQSLNANIKSLRKKRVEADERKLLQTKLLAPTYAVMSGGPKSLATTTQQGLSVGDRLLGFVRYAAAGWVLGNLPTWVGLGNNLVQRIGQAGGILSNYGDETLGAVSAIGNLFKSLVSDAASFDFLDESSQVKNSFGDLMSHIDELKQGFSDVLNMATQPFENVPPLGTDQLEVERQQLEQQAQGTTAAQPTTPSEATTLSGGMSNIQKQALNILSKYESASAGGYNAVNQIGVSGGRGVLPGSFSGDFRNMKQHKGRALTDMTIAEIMALQAEVPGMSNQEWINQGRLHAVGRYQFIGSTLPGVVKRAGIPLSAKFTPEVQDLLALQYLKEAGIGAWVGPSDNATAQERAIIDQARKEPINLNVSVSTGTPQPQQPQQAQITATPAQTNVPITPPQIDRGKIYRKKDVLTNTIGRGVDYVEITDAYKDPSRPTHLGIDIATPTGTYIALKLDCEVVFAGWQNPNNHREGYGQVIDVWVPQLSVQLRFGHCSSFLITSGKIPAGKSFARVGSTGNSSGPHIHFEYTKTKNGRDYGSDSDPSPYIPYILLTNQQNNSSVPQQTITPAPTSSVPLVPIVPATTQGTSTQVQAQIDSNYQQGVADGITQERQGRKIVVVDDRSNPPAQQVNTGGGGGGMILSINESALLNNFIKNKLLLDLNYV